MARNKVRPASDRRPWMIASVAALVVVVAGAGVWTMRSAADSPVSKERVTLDPQLFNGEAHAAYEVAAKDPGLLAQLHCYCGCDKELGHHNLLDCYRNKHAAQCPICMGEAIEAAKLAKEGLPVEQIRRVLRDDYGHGD